MDLADSVHDLWDGKPVIEIVNAGNWGDALVHAGHNALYRDFGINPIRIPAQRFGAAGWICSEYLSKRIANRTLVTGVARCKKYSCPKETAASAKLFPKVMAMPSSFPMMPDLDLTKNT